MPSSTLTRRYLAVTKGASLLFSLLFSLASCLPHSLGTQSSEKPLAADVNLFTSTSVKTLPQQSVSVLSGAVTKGILQEAWFFGPGLLENNLFLNALWSQTLAEVYLRPEFTAFDAILLADRRLISWEAEVNFASHFGTQDHVEFNVLFLARWHAFIIDKLIDMSWAIGEGLSYASSIPKVEAERWVHTSQLLNYMVYEMTFGVKPEYVMLEPPIKQLDFVMRIHHRSGVYGTFNGATEGSNVAAFGLRFSF